MKERPILMSAPMVLATLGEPPANMRRIVELAVLQRGIDSLSGELPW